MTFMGEFYEFPKSLALRKDINFAKNYRDLKTDWLLIYGETSKISRSRVICKISSKNIYVKAPDFQITSSGEVPTRRKDVLAALYRKPCFSQKAIQYSRIQLKNITKSQCYLWGAMGFNLWNFVKCSPKNGWGWSLLTFLFSQLFLNGNDNCTWKCGTRISVYWIWFLNKRKIKIFNSRTTDKYLVLFTYLTMIKDCLTAMQL